MKIEQQNPDFYYKEDGRIIFVKNSYNERYPYFRQNYKTAGDLEQFLEKWGNFPRDIERNRNIIQKYERFEIPFQNDLCISDYFNTFQYINEKFKKGCFIQIHMNEMKTYIPFSKQNFKNEWGDKIIIDPKFGTIYNMMKYLSEYDKTYPYDEKRIHRDVHSWYGNNGLIRFEFPLSENDNGYNMLKDMFLTLSKEREIPDVDFFLNKRDFPILRKDGMESYDCFFGKDVPLKSHSYNKYVPILSMNTTKNHMDIAIPTWEDWRFVSYLYDKKIFWKDYQTYPCLEEFDSISWEEKIPTIIWRGTSTGRGTTVDDNIRLFYYKYSKKDERDSDGHLFMDVKFTKWNLRPRKHPNNPYVRTILKEDFDFETVEHMSPIEQAKYKYCINLPGHSCAYRLSLQLFSGSLIFSYPCDNYLWFFNWLKPWVHYIPIEKEFDMDEIKKKIKWCKENDEQCKEIVKNARKFADEHLSRDGILDYLQKILCSIAEKNKIQYNQNSLHCRQLSNIKYKLFTYEESMYQIFTDLFQKDVFLKERQYFNYYLFFLKRTNNLNSFLERNLKKSDVIHSKKTKINIYEHKGLEWAEKVVQKNWKQDDLHQIFVGYYFINHLRNICPHFIHTYCHKEEGKQTKIYMEYKPYQTLDKIIRNNDIRFIDLVHIWLNLCLALEISQNYCGFMHMDLYPWNILIQKKKKKVCYNELGIETNFDFFPIMIDYGNSHISDNGFHYYNTTPFQLNSFTDVICMIISSLDIFLSKITLDGNEMKLLFTILRYLYQNSSIENKNFESIHQVKKFIKINKKFSKMLCNIQCLENKRPLDFVYFLYDNHFISKNDIRFFEKKTNPYDSVYYPNILQNFFHHIRIFLCLLNEEEWTKLSIDSIYTLIRRIFIGFKKIVQKIHYENEVQKKLMSYNIHFFLDQYKKMIEIYQNKFKKKVWVNHSLSTVLNIRDDYPIEKFDNSFFDEVRMIKTHSFNLPFLKTHNCIQRNDEKNDVSCFFFDKVQLLYLLGERNNFFNIRNQIYNKK